MLTGLSVTDLALAREAVEVLQDTGSRCVVLTLGEKGVLYSVLLAGKQWSKIQHIPAQAVKVVDTTVSGTYKEKPLYKGQATTSQ